MEASREEKSSNQPQTKKNLTNYNKSYNIQNLNPRLMSPNESNESPVSSIRSRTSDLPKVGDALKRMVLTDERCFGDAERLNEYWKRKPDGNYESVSYDPDRKRFLLVHRHDGVVAIDVERFYELVARKTMFLIQKTIQELSREVLVKIRSINK